MLFAMPSASLDPDKVRDIYEMILHGHSRANIDQFCRADLDMESEPLILAAMTLFENEAKTSFDVQMGWCLESLKELYRKSMDVGEFSAAAKCVREVAELARRMKSHNQAKSATGT